VLINKIKSIINIVTEKLPFPLFVFLVIVILGIISSIITAIIASLLLVEIIHALPIRHKAKLRLAVVACFSIGLGAVLTPIGEPLATITISKLDTGFWYLLDRLGIYIIPEILALGVFGAYFIKKDKQPLNCNNKQQLNNGLKDECSIVNAEEVEIKKDEKLSEVFLRAFKIFVFIIALEMLGAGFKPLIDTYLVKLDSMLLYWINMVSAILDNATLAAAEISPAMSALQVKAILMGLLISGGMLIPGNIPNIIAAAKLKIKSSEWAVIGIPIGLVILFITNLLVFCF
jgi:predicted cation transporter